LEPRGPWRSLPVGMRQRGSWKVFNGRAPPAGPGGPGPAKTGPAGAKADARDKPPGRWDNNISPGAPVFLKRDGRRPKRNPRTCEDCPRGGASGKTHAKTFFWRAPPTGPAGPRAPGKWGDFQKGVGPFGRLKRPARPARSKGPDR